MLPPSNRTLTQCGNLQLTGKKNEKALRGHPEGFLGGLTSLSIDVVKSSKF